MVESAVLLCSVTVHCTQYTVTILQFSHCAQYTVTILQFSHCAQYTVTILQLSHCTQYTVIILQFSQLKIQLGLVGDHGTGPVIAAAASSVSSGKIGNWQAGLNQD